MKLDYPLIKPKSRFHITNILLILNTLVFLYLIFSPPEMKQYIFSIFAFSMKNFSEGAIWSPVTSMFLHGSLAHLALNMISLFFFGRALESEISKKKYLAIYFAGGILASIISGMLRPVEVPGVGASGAIFAIIAASMIIKPFEFVAFPYVLPVPIMFIAIVMIVSNVLLAFNPPEGSNISFSAHIVGFVVGLLFGLHYKGLKRFVLVISVGILLFLLASQYLQAISILDYTNILQNFLS